MKFDSKRSLGILLLPLVLSACSSGNTMPAALTSSSNVQAQSSSVSVIANQPVHLSGNQLPSDSLFQSVDFTSSTSLPKLTINSSLNPEAQNRLTQTLTITPSKHTVGTLAGFTSYPVETVTSDVPVTFTKGFSYSISVAYSASPTGKAVNFGSQSGTYHLAAFDGTNWWFDFTGKAGSVSGSGVSFFGSTSRVLTLAAGTYSIVMYLVPPGVTPIPAATATPTPIATAVPTTAPTDAPTPAPTDSP